MAQLQPRLTIFDLPLEIRLKIWKIAVQDSQPEELYVCNHANGSEDDPGQELSFSIPLNPQLRLRLTSKAINSELDLLNPRHSTTLPCRSICNDNSAPRLIFCHSNCITRFLARLTSRGRLATQEMKIVRKREKEDNIETWFSETFSSFAGISKAFIECICQDLDDLRDINITCRGWRHKETEQSCSGSDMYNMHVFRREGCANLPKKLPVLCGKS